MAVVQLAIVLKAAPLAVVVSSSGVQQVHGPARTAATSFRTRDEMQESASSGEVGAGPGREGSGKWSVRRGVAPGRFGSRW